MNAAVTDTIDMDTALTKTQTHVLRITHDTDTVLVAVECRSETGAVCRLKCAEDCQAESYPCASYGPNDSERVHGLVDQGECNATLFLADCPAECCDADGPFPLFDGMPVEVTWNGDGYTWSPIQGGAA